MMDEEMPPVDGFDDDDDDEMSDMDLPGESDSLPEGIKKEIITQVQGWRKPKAGDEVTVHYVGTLASDGSEFDSSRKRGQPFVFMLGKNQVIKGWDLGVATMLKGEVAKFTLAPEFAYGPSGSPPDIPPDATLNFEVELLSWLSKDDLFGDEGVIKSVVEEPTGYSVAKEGSEVNITVKATTKDGTVIEEHTGMDYAIGSDSERLGSIGKVVDKALCSMKRGEEVSLACTKEYAYGDQHPDGATITVKLQEIFSTRDVSFAKDASIMKKQIKEGDGFDTPKDGCQVKLAVSKATDEKGAELPGFSPVTLELACGDGQVCDALECVAAEMKRGERAVITTKPALAAEPKLGLKDIKAEKVVLHVEMQDFEKKKETWDMSDDEKIEFGTERKEVGSNLLKAGRYQLALLRYKKVTDLFSFVDNYSEDNKAKAKALKIACDANKAAVYLKLKNWEEAKHACDSVLKDDKQHVKCLFRRAQAQLQLKNFLECIADCKKVVELDPQNKDARALWKQGQAAQKEEDKKSKGLFQNMCKALGKGPIPEPGKTAPIGESDDSDGDDGEEDAPMPEAAKVEE